MPKATTPSFVTTFELVVDSYSERVLNVRFEAARQIYNACLGEAERRRCRMQASPEYAAAKALPKAKSTPSKPSERAVAFRHAREAHGYSAYGLHAWLTARISTGWCADHVGSNMAQKLATRAFDASRMHAVGRRGRPRFKTWRSGLHSVEEKTNRTGAMWKGDHLEWGDHHGRKLVLRARINSNDPVHAHALAAKVKYVRVVRYRLNGRDRFAAQLVCEGHPYVKAANTTTPGGVVAIDVGPSTIGWVAKRADGTVSKAGLQRFCAELTTDQAARRRLQRHLDRQRRAANPDCYDDHGRVIKGKRPTNETQGMRRTRNALAETARRLAAYRKSLHGHLANKLIREGNTVKFEDLSYKALQRRYGKSVGFRAPGSFVALLARKAESAGGQAVAIPTYTTKLSQTCICGNVERKPLSQRVHHCECGARTQRDLMSAYLASFVDVTVTRDGKRQVTVHADQARAAWSGSESALQTAWEHAVQAASRNGMSGSLFGPPKERHRRQSDSSAIVSGTTEAASRPRRSRRGRVKRRVSGSPRTPRL